MWKWIKAENCRYESANLCKKRAGKCPEQTKEARMDGNEEKIMAVKKKVECENSQSSKGIERIIFKRRNTAVYWNSKIELDG